MNRELQATLDDLARMKVGDDDELDSLLSAPTVGADLPAGFATPGLLTARRWVLRSG